MDTQVTDDDRAALLERDVAVITVETSGERLQLWVTAPDSEKACGVVRDRFGPDVDVSVCGSAPREILHEHWVVVRGFICTPVLVDNGDCSESRYTERLEEPVGDRFVIDGFSRQPVLRLH